MSEARRFPRCGLATPHHLASAAGLAAFAGGGNAVDAIVAANLALGVVAPYSCGYGGDLFAVVWDGDLHGYLGSGRSASAASAERVRSEHGSMPVLGGHTVTVPGAPAGWFDLLERWGTRPFEELAAHALRYARDGFEVSAHAGIVFDGCRAVYADYPDWQAVYGEARPGGVLRQPALARTIDALARDGPDAYYEGPIADAIADAVQADGGPLVSSDVKVHAGRWCEPLRAPYRDVEIAELPPPTQGVTPLEALRILDGFDVPPDGVARQHLLIEVLKLALADRDAYVTDPDAMVVSPSDLLSDGWIAERRAALDLGRARAPEPGRAQVGGTAYLCAADGDGLLVSLIQSNFFAFGCGVHVAEWGINLNNRGSSFSTDDAHSNALAPSKLPMHTLIPAMGLRDGEPWLVFGSEGGDTQAQVHVQLLTRLLHDDLDLQAALDAPRLRIEWGSDRLTVEQSFGEEIVEGLRARGHHVREAYAGYPNVGLPHAIRRTPNGYAVATDPRTEGAALGL